ncbi:YhzD family protein [Bacillus massilinigeriensis]|uniref:YhzD family protein n=1 Tax=Bacillus mediterraneensis TaxID=1805474 RepID=UPI0008F94C36|nr:YhzD family protein [Bacillus mediterraneensis]
MGTYKLTAFGHNGEKMVDESFQAENDDAAKETGKKLIEEKNLQDITHRCTSPKGKLILFHP